MKNTIDFAKMRRNTISSPDYNDIWFWLYENGISDMRKQVDETDGYPEKLELSDEEATLFILRWGGYVSEY